MPEDARSALLAAVRSATDAVRDADVDGAYEEVARDYRRHGEASVEARLELLCERLADYGVRVTRTSGGGVANAVAAWAAERTVRSWVVPPGLPDAWLARTRDVDVVPDDADPRALDAADAVVTGCAVAVAETGSIVLDAGPGQGRRAATLVPDAHLCVVRASQVVELVPEAIDVLTAAARSGRPLTWVSGPSATSDIELVRVAGVHGPRTLAVVLLEGA
ncbi:MAG: lactate utilization protein C [Trueperaceae bacterium]|nr:MAG: lactate utilization protein C [Trueperaceae bacterium]